MPIPDRWIQEWSRRLPDLTELRLADMDAHGVDMQALSLAFGVEVIIDHAKAVAVGRKVNDYLAEAVGAHGLRLIYGGVFDQFPGASLTLGHMGELLPFQLARLDSRYQQVAPGRRPPHPPSHYLRHNVYVTTSGVCSHAALLRATHAVGTDRVL